ncbi:hypothetical protein FXO38_01405 [Capsicum annuum]|nr:hypothetical protein FXO38_01405 [Capsicum annuum]
MVENEKYESFPWGKTAFFKLMASLRQEFFVDKQLYSLGGNPQVLNVRMFELCSNIDIKVVVKESNKHTSSIELKGPSNADSPLKVSDKSIEMEGSKVNQAPSPIKYGENDEMDVGIEKMDDIVVEEMEPLDTVGPNTINDMTLTVYKPPPKTLDEYTTADCFFKVYIDKAYMNYYHADVGKKLQTQKAFVITNEVAQMEMSLINTIRELSTLAVVYAEYLSEGLVIPSLDIDAQYHRLRYASFLCKYGFVKVEKGYFSENDNSPRQRSRFTTKEKGRVLHIE